MLLHVDVANRGPRPLRMRKCWADFPGYADFVRKQWGTFNTTGWGGFVLQQKLKLIKTCLKDWHHNHTKNLDATIMGV